MKKNKKTGTTQHNAHDLPNIVDMDSLAYAGDGDLEARLSFLNGGRDKALRVGQDPYSWEVELAYLQRERDIRRLRLRLHEQYLAKNPEHYGDYREVVDDDVNEVPNDE